MENIKIIALDLDETLIKNMIPLCVETREILFRLKEKYMLVMVESGRVRKIYDQMVNFPVDIIGNYGMQFARYNQEKKDLEIVHDYSSGCDREDFEKKATFIREKYGYTDYSGDSLGYHPSGCVTFPMLGTGAGYDDKMAFDPDSSKRRAIYDEVKKLFEGYNVFVAGPDSFDIVPVPYSKYYALSKYCEEKGVLHNEVIFVGNEYGPNGSDESVYKSDFGFIKIDNYHEFKEKIAHLL